MDKNFDLEKRTLNFGKEIICFVKKVPRNIFTDAGFVQRESKELFYIFNAIYKNTKENTP